MDALVSVPRKRRYSTARVDFLSAASALVGGDCALWPFAVRASSGYGAHSERFAGGKLNIDAHVKACTLAHGERPSPAHQAAHSCGNRLCCNGSHLRWATPAQNMADAMEHGTLIGGGRHRQKIGPQELDFIRTANLSLIQLGKRFSMSPSYMGRLRRMAEAA